MIGSFIKKLIFEFWPFIRKHMCFIRKWIYKKETFRHDVVIDVCNNADAIMIDLNGSDPKIRINFNLHNKSEYLDVMFDRAVISITAGYQIPGETFLITPYHVCKKDSQFLYCEFVLNKYQYELINNWLKSNGRIEKVDVTVKYIIKSSLYELNDSVRLENKACKVVNVSATDHL